MWLYYGSITHLPLSIVPVNSGVHLRYLGFIWFTILNLRLSTLRYIDVLGLIRGGGFPGINPKVISVRIVIWFVGIAIEFAQ